MTSGPIAVIEPEPLAEDTIEVLEDLLAKTREGRISTVAIAVVYRDGTTGDAWARGNLPLKIAATSVLHHRLCNLIAKDTE